MAVTTCVYLASTGEPFTLPWPLLKLEYALVVNAISRLQATYQTTAMPPSIWLPDGQILIQRMLPTGEVHIPGPYRWFVQRVRQTATTIIIDAVSPLWLIAEPGRIVADYAGTSATSMTMPADNMLKQIMANLAALDGVPIPNLVIGASTGMAPTITRSFAWREVLRVCQDIATQSQQDGVYLAFDITALPDGRWLFETYPHHRGADRRSSLILDVFGPQVANGTLTIDYEQEATSVLVGGAGERTERIVGAASDLNRQQRTPYRFRRLFKDFTQATTYAEVVEEARRIVRASRPRILIEGEVLDAPGCQWGKHWDWGDYVTVRAGAYTLDARIDAVQVRVAPDSEDVRAIFKTEAYV